MKKTYTIIITFLCVLQAYAQNVIGEETYKNYRFVHYSNGMSRIIDKGNNWIQFVTEYETNSFTGEVSSIPIKAEEYIDNRRKMDISAAELRDSENRYSISLMGDTVTMTTPVGISIAASIVPQISLNGFYDKKQIKNIVTRLYSLGATISTHTINNEMFVSISKSTSNYIWYLDSRAIITNTKRDVGDFNFPSKGFDSEIVILNSNRLDEIYSRIYRMFFNPSSLVPSFSILTGGKPSSVMTTISLIMEYAELFGNEIIVKGPNKNVLTKTDNYTLKLLNGNTYPGGYYDSYTKRMYYPTIENYMFQGCSVSTGNTKFSSITEDDIVWIKSQRSNVLDHIIINDSIGELYFNNGDYLKYSKLQRGQVYDCRMNLPSGLCIIKLDNAKPVSIFKCTQGRYKDVTLEIENKYYYDDLLIDFINPEGNKDLESAYWKAVDAHYDQMAKEEAESYAIIETVSTDSIEAAKKAERKKALDNLNAKYGKKYVDALFNEGKILVGTPEGLVRDHTNSELISETQYTRTYKISGYFRDWASTVRVDVKTRKVISVRNWTY
jgi:hypothetical protein